MQQPGRRRSARSPARLPPTYSEPHADTKLDDFAIASLPAAAPGGSPPKPALQAMGFGAQGLKALFHIFNLPVCVVLLAFGEGLLGTFVYSSIAAVAGVQALLYAILFLFAASTTAQGWITFGHPAKVIGAANSSGPFDRGARALFGMRDFSQPADAGLAHARQVHIDVAGSSGARLGAWHTLPCSHTRDVLEMVARGEATADAAFDQALRTRPVDDDGTSPLAALYLHGNFESRAKWVSTEHSRLLSSHFGLHVLVIDYRGFADSTGGPPTPDTLGEDAHAAIDWLSARGLPPSRVLLYGHSLGTGAAAQLALRLQAYGTMPFGAVLEAPFFSLRAAALTFPAALPLLALPGGLGLVLSRFMDGCRTADALVALPRLSVLILHGDEDTTVPIQHSVELVRRLRAARLPSAIRAAGGRGKAAIFRYETLEGCDHLQALLHPKTILALSEFVRAVAERQDQEA